MDLDQLLSLPLLSKGLLEQSMQRKTFACRALFAVALYSGGLWIYEAHLQNGLASLGKGADILTELVWLQAAVTFAIIPLIACGSIAGEKERNTLELLMLTKLSLRGIVVEKFSALFVSVGILQLLALPLLVLTYPMGGVESTAVVAAFIQLACAAAIALAWAVFCSCWAYTTYGAIWVYLTPAPLALLGMIPAGPAQQILFPLIALYGCTIFIAGMIHGAHLLESINSQSKADDRVRSDAPAAKAELSRSLRAISIQAFIIVAGSLAPTFQHVVPYAMAVMLTAGILAILFTVGPAMLMVRRRRPMIRAPADALVAVDLAVREVNNLSLRGIAFKSNATSLPDDQPVAWLELRQLGFHWRTLIWNTVAVEFVLVMVLVSGLDSNRHDEFSTIWLVMETLLWGISLMGLVAYATGLFQAQIMETILTTPLSAAEIVRQRMSGIRRAIAVASVPLVTMWLARVCWFQPSKATTTDVWWNHWLSNFVGLAAIGIFPSLAAWLGVLSGMQPNRIRGLLTATGMVAGLCLVPWLAEWLDQSRWLLGFPVTPMSPFEILHHQRYSLFGLAISVTLSGLALVTVQLATQHRFCQTYRLESGTA
ncbi:MAG: hypothetical protein JSS49_25860 [Planctomycetes bacterium]|nr:hypothetical protein [Planctomycetota bacterium]